MKSRTLQAIILMLLAIMLALIAGCGQKGHLYIPDETHITDIFKV